MVRVFGFKHPDLESVALPAGEACAWCDETINGCDFGFVSPAWGRGSPTASYHYYCYRRQFTGSVGHQLQLCLCFNAGGGEVLHSFEDPPYMTKRQAAIAAVLLFEALHV